MCPYDKEWSQAIWVGQIDKVPFFGGEGGKVGKGGFPKMSVANEVKVGSMR